MTGFSVHLEQAPGCDIATPRGDLDVFSSGRLRSVVFDPTSCAQGVLVIDLSDVTFIDSTGLGVLVATRRWTRSRSAELVLVVRPGSVVARVLAVAGLYAVFTTVATRDEAVPSLDSPALADH